MTNEAASESHQGRGGAGKEKKRTKKTSSKKKKPPSRSKKRNPLESGRGPVLRVKRGNALVKSPGEKKKLKFIDESPELKSTLNTRNGHLKHFP